MWPGHESELFSTVCCNERRTEVQTSKALGTTSMQVPHTSDWFCKFSGNKTCVWQLGISQKKCYWEIQQFAVAAGEALKKLYSSCSGKFSCLSLSVSMTVTQFALQHYSNKVWITATNSHQTLGWGVRQCHPVHRQHDGVGSVAAAGEKEKKCLCFSANLFAKSICLAKCLPKEIGVCNGVAFRVISCSTC